MADTELWPVSTFYFTVDFGNGMKEVSFQEVTGLDAELQMVEHRVGGSPILSGQRIPSLSKLSTITLKKGIIAQDHSFFEWYATVKTDTFKLTTVAIKLRDKTGKAMMTWTLQNALITKISATDLKSDSNEVAIESIELAHEGFRIANS